MQHSAERILTTHTGSLPRPSELVEALLARDRGELADGDADALAGRVRDAVQASVASQRAAGLDVVNDGEMSKVGYATYVRERMTGFGGEDALPAPQDLLEHQDFAMTVLGNLHFRAPACTGDVAYTDTSAVQEDIATLKASAGDGEAFMSAASPGVISLFFHNQHYPSHEAYLGALADAMKTEYDAIHEAGLLLQLDCPDFAMGRHMQFADASLDEFRRNLALHVEALNHATRDVPADRMRVHLCWGNYEGPHHHDVPLADIYDIVMGVEAEGLLFEGANPRHEHEWRVFADKGVPDDKVLIPGVIDSTTNYVEHPELVADRLERYAQVVGRERVIAGTDCGFETFAKYNVVTDAITWMKMQAMADGARLASQRLW